MLVMLAGCSDLKEDKGQKIWDSTFLSKIEKTINQTVKGDGKTHLNSLGSFLGFGSMAKQPRWPSIIWHGETQQKGQ